MNIATQQVDKEEEIIKVSKDLANNFWINKQKYQQMYQESIDNPDIFWKKQASKLNWDQDFTKVKNTSFSKNNVSIKWFEDGKLNVVNNCIDRHLDSKADKIAIIWEGDNPEESELITYKKLHEEVCKFANALKKQNVKKGDRVIIYLPMIPQAAYAMLACARIGAIHSVVFGGFSPEALKGRIEDCDAKIIITADEAIRGNKKVPLKANVDKAIELGANIKTNIIVKRTGSNININENIDLWYDDLVKNESTECEAISVGAEDPLFILYTSGSTGKPKGVLHTTGGYLLYASITHEYVFNYHEDDIYWCSADVGWVTGHSYVIYGPLANGATTVMFEGVPNYPDYSRFWQIIDKHQVSIFYTAPTAIRALMKEGDDFVKNTSRKSLKLLGTVGEPINPEAWNWYYDVVGENRCPIVDTWWQTETGGHLITPLPGATDLKPGSATLPFFGIKPEILDNQNNIINNAGEGALYIADSWPGQMRTIYNDHQRFINTYFSQCDGKYFTGDGAKRDKDGYYWITGRIDDVLNISGHRLGTAEIESALVENHNVAEAAIVGFPHDITGQAIYAFVTLNSDIEPNEEIKTQLIKWVRSKIGPIAKIEKLQFSENLPKTRSGKIMRRILRKIAENDYENLGDINTLTNPDIVEKLIKNRIK